MKLKIEYVDIDSIKPYKNNPRINDMAVDKVANSIKEFGFKVPVIVDSGGVLITGHTRIKAAKKLGMKEVPTIKADDLTPEQVKAFRLADNKVSELAEWNFEMLDQELDDLLNMDIDMGEFGFDNLEEEIQSNNYEMQDLKENKIQFHKCPECGCEFED